LPLQRDATHQHRSYRFSVIRVQSGGDGVSILTEQSDAVSIFSRRPSTRRSFFLRNRRRSEAIEGSSYRLRPEITVMRFIPLAIGLGHEAGSGFGIAANMIQFPPMYGVPEGVPLALDDEWVEESELVIVRSTESGSVERRLAVANFPIRLN
jgi:hypothetical protein